MPNGTPRIPYTEMFTISKNFYNRADRHFLQERVKLDKRKYRTLALEPVPNKKITDKNYFRA
ncbi:UNVERIFIED_CONTAM: hypothetical protein O8I53_13685 [Campylobacter lari]